MERPVVYAFLSLYRSSLFPRRTLKKNITSKLICLLIGIAILSMSQFSIGQTTSGVISGQTVDSQGAAIPGAHISLTDQQTGSSQTAVTDKSGLFVFPVVKPGSYTVTAEKDGFQKTEKTNLTLLAADRLSVGTLQLQVGSVNTVVTVTSNATPVQVTSSERSTQITSEQMTGLMSLGRDFTSLMRILPGSTYEGNGNAQLNAAGVGNFNGVSNNYVSINTDGVASNTRNVGVVEGPLNMDSVQEVKVLDANYQAEYGKVSGAIVDVVSKSGSRDFHGSAAYYLRNEDMNANSYFNNRNGLPRSRYRYNTINGTIGGPIYGPGAMKSLRDKLFFFFSEDYEPDNAPEGISYTTVPTQLERQGDFSQSVNSSGQPYTVLNPTTGQPFAGNVVPSQYIMPNMQKLMSIFPLPNFTNRSVSQGNYNYVLSDTADTPSRQEILRLDFNPSDKWRIYFRGTNLHDDETGRNTPTNNNYNSYWMAGTSYYNTQAPSFALNLTYTATPNIVNELALGVGLWFETSGMSQTTLNQFSKTAQGIDLGQLYPQNNPLNLIPGFEFDDVPNSVGSSWDPRFPMNDTVITPSISDGLSVVHGNHNMKFGIYADNAVYKQANHAGNSSFSGYFTFDGANPNNPFNTGYSFAEALMGYFDEYQESSARPTYYGVSNTFEWYAQDNWKATRKLTLEYGLRFTLDIPQSLKNKQGASLFFDSYNAADAPPLFQPVIIDGQRMMKDPVTGQIYPAAYYGAFVPGVGNSAPGSIAASDPNFPGFFKGQGVLVAPRLGFAYDVFGNGKTAVRGGFGIFNNQRTFQGAVGNLTFNPPTISYPTQYYGNVATFLSAQGVLTPSSTSVLQRNSRLPQNMNMTLGIQQDIGAQTVLDIAYVGVLGRHQQYGVNVNEVPYGAEFLAQNQDPTTGTPLADNYFRPYPGYGNINETFWGDNSNYNSLQVQVNKRFSNGIQFGAAYTWSKVLDDNKRTLYLPASLTYGVNSVDRPQRLVMNWLANLPKASRAWNNWATRSILDNWQVSGIATFSAGAPQSVTYTTTDGENITGGGDGSKVVITGQAQLSRGDRTFHRFFDTSVYARPQKGMIGDGWRPQFYGPGINDWDMSLIKNIPIEKINLQIRGEAYNVFNHTQFSSVDTGAKFDPSGNQVNSDFGSYTGARDPRLMQVAARISF